MSRLESFHGSLGNLVVRVWDHPQPQHLVVVAHGFGEHIGRYEYVAERLLKNGAAVLGPDHVGHGRSDGERAVIADFHPVVDDLARVVDRAKQAHPGLPLVLIGHSMGGLIATRYAQSFGNSLDGLVLSGPALGILSITEMLLSLPEIPDMPIDPSILSRDPDVGAAYAADELVHHGSLPRPTVAAMRDAILAAQEAGGFGSLPTLWMHGSDDSLVPLAETRERLEPLRGSDFHERIYEGARHEIFNETNRDEVLDDVCAFIRRIVK